MSSTSMTAARDVGNELESQKYELLKIIQDTQRGLVTTADQRSIIEEAMVVVESFDAGKEIDLNKLDGTWRLQYTSASDVVILFESAARLPFFQVGQIFQKFECKSGSRGGLVRNVIKWSVPRLLEENEGATLIVSARFSCVSARNIYLKFEEKSISCPSEVVFWDSICCRPCLGNRHQRLHCKFVGLLFPVLCFGLLSS
nr:PREDICTED: probable plastid-lipid-associated protein 10, chloroplastic isoform X2 [Nicotiana sylvestris]